MADKSLPTTVADDSEKAPPAPERKDRMVQAVVTGSEVEEIGASLKREGFRNTSQGLRAMALAFARHRDVRKAVMRHAPALLLTPESEDAA